MYQDLFRAPSIVYIDNSKELGEKYLETSKTVTDHHNHVVLSYLEAHKHFGTCIANWTILLCTMYPCASNLFCIDINTDWLSKSKICFGNTNVCAQSDCTLLVTSNPLVRPAFYMAIYKSINLVSDCNSCNRLA